MRNTCMRFAAIAFVVMALDLAPSAPAFNSPNDAAPQASAAPAAADPCCTADAMKKIAASVGFVDVVGVKLGMSPTQAFGAIKAYNPNLKIDIMNAYITIPSTGQTKVPHLAVAHTVNPKIVGGPGGFNLPDHSSEEIVIEFTTPPSSAVVAKVTRVVTFPSDQPVVASNLLDSLRKKYGQDNFSDGVSRDWIYDTSGKLLTRSVTTPERACLPQNTSTGFPSNVLPSPDDVIKGNGGNITLDTTTLNEASNLMVPERRSICSAFVIVEDFGLGGDVAPNKQMTQLDVTMQSGALLYNSQKATHDWLQSDADAVQKKKDGAAAARSGPQL
jgi:hypothetical protein